MKSRREITEDANVRGNAERIWSLAKRARITSGLALALVLKHGNDERVLDREAAKLRRGGQEDDA